MGSLQDQLLKSGLVSEEQLKKSKSNARKQNKRKPKQSKATRAKPAVSDASRAAGAASAERRSRDRALNQARNAERDRRTRLGQLRAVLDEHRMNGAEGEIKHFYQSGKKIKQIWVDKQQQQGLIDGKLFVAVLEGRGHLLKRELEARLLKIDPEQQDIRIVNADSGAAGSDDAYADHPVPDDLMW
jgi:uncharacterized protein YaiL (DUF2058 family)